MHVIFREQVGLDQTDTPYDPGQTPGDLVVLSFSDSDLGAFAEGWRRAAGGLPPTRLCNLVALRHPVSVDAYVENTLSGARGILIRLIGGEAYWPYGLASVQDLARRKGIALAVLPADGRDDPRLDEVSTVPASVLRVLRRHCDQGGAVAAQAALAQMAVASGLEAAPVPGVKALPQTGFYDPDRGVLPEPGGVQALVTFYRSWLAAADMAPIDALIRALRDRGIRAMGAFAPSLKAPGLEEWLMSALPGAPELVVNATGFSGGGGGAPFGGWSCPVFQVALSTNRRRDWLAAERGLSPPDLAMNVVLPEIDGRIFAGNISFKAVSPRDPDLQFARFVHRPDPDLLAQAVDRIAAWHALARGARRVAMVLSTYPGRDWQQAHAVGLDAPASAQAVGQMLGTELPGLPQGTIAWPLAAYRAALPRLPQALRDDLHAAWGAPETDPDCRDGAFHLRASRHGPVILALQPERSHREGREDSYHDLTRVPRHEYVAFYLWLAEQAPDLLIHMGAHGTLEWLPGKAVALSGTCWPQALLGAMPVIYPFIVNDPGEAAQAKRRIGAVTLGHMPPPMREAALPPGMAGLERSLDEYSTADGLDPARRDRLIAAIRDEARALGVEADLGIPPDASAAEAITRIDRFVCDIKESQYGEGLHVWGSGPCGDAERDGLMAALAGRFVPPGPSGSPHRGRSDVMPTGRNLFSVDPRAVPTPAAHAQGVKLAEELLRRHLQDHGDWPRGLVVDLWGSATMRTAGEEFAMALHLAGLKPVWDSGSGRVTGVEIVPLALLGRPRIDVTLRVSGLFRDVFPALAQLFQTGAEALAARDEAPDQNPYSGGARVFGPQPGQYGLGMGTAPTEFTEAARQAAGEAWIAASSWAIGPDGASHKDRDALEGRLARADSFVHAQDLPESDLLLAADYAAHEGGFAAAMARIGGRANLYHLDATRPDRPRARTLNEEIARTIRARAADPAWADAMTRHGYRGAAEIAATLDHLAAFAHLAGAVPPHLFDLYHEATLSRPEIVAFMAEANPAALAAMGDLFQRLHDAGLWVTRRNSIRAGLA
ncbi:cobaltochelatase subunit CobN [Paracoccus sp. (in: a-proteobacteria)]|uniref:cobaltochelatase subunit CobN n=1 Tax=Paracoccus sp. TaxID=267 RepID=UPI00272CFE6B|nr:cobaltochelatase subunit CobN [Paracoccus sp. (in: a-proteobacteria)]